MIGKYALQFDCTIYKEDINFLAYSPGILLYPPPLIISTLL